MFQHIEFLLLRHDCVIVPGLGAFIATAVPAKIDMENGVIVPPSRSVMFNQSVTVDDGLLANSYARKSSLSFEDARQIIARDVNALKSDLLVSGCAKCGRLGQFVRSEEGNMVFAPLFDSEPLSSKIGFSTVSMASCCDEDASVSPDVIDNEETMNDRDRCQSYYYFRIRKSLTRIAAAVVLVAAVAVAAFMLPVPDNDRMEKASVVPVEAILPVKKVVKSVEKTVVADTVVKQQEPRLHSHYLIIATFSSDNEAKAYAEKHSTTEYPLTAVASKRMTRVAIAASDDRDSLRRQLNSHYIASKYPNAWIWSRQ